MRSQYDMCAIIDPKEDDLTMTRPEWAEPVDVA